VRQESRRSAFGENPNGKPRNFVNGNAELVLNDGVWSSVLKQEYGETSASAIVINGISKV
jgi:rhamnogalacturonyl hydrolase YesR